MLSLKCLQYYSNLVVIGGKNRYKIQQFDDMPCGRPHYTIKDIEADKVIFEIKRGDLCTSAICCNDVVYDLYGTFI